MTINKQENFIKRLLRFFLAAAMKFVWKQSFQHNSTVSPVIYFKHFIIQKILRINSHVPWPVHWTTQVLSPEMIERGTRCPGLAISCFLDGRNGIVLGENVWLGPRVSLISQNHSNTNFSSYLASPPITIGRNSLLTSNVIILPGVELGEHTVVAAGSVVTKSFPQKNQLLAGNPARPIKQLPPYEAN